MSETEKEMRRVKSRFDTAARMRSLAEKMEKKAEELMVNGRYTEALECYEVAGYLKAAAKIVEDLERTLKV